MSEPKTLSTKDQEAFTATAERMEAKYGLGEPLAIIRVYPQGRFLTGGTSARDHVAVSRTLVDVAASELEFLRGR